MKSELTRELVERLTPFIDAQNLEDIKMQISICLSGYEISKSTTELDIYRGSVNEEIMKRFLAAKIAQGCSRRTIKYYKESIYMTLLKIGKNYDQITADDIRYYLATRVQNDGVSKTTANNERRNLSAFYTWLQREEILLKNPMSKVDSIKTKKEKKKAFSQMELERIRESCTTGRERALIEILISTWARVSEVSQIKIEEMEGEKVTVHGKGDKDRDVFLTPKAQLMIKKYLEERNDENPYLFPRAKYAGKLEKFTKGRKRSDIREWYKDPEKVDAYRPTDAGTIESIVRRIGADANVAKTHPHRFRRTGATLALRSGMPLIQVSNILGHESIGTTQIYLDVSNEELMQAHAKYV